jgi:uncharacterized protein YdhG (YjbR/CyaY superfamily)
MGTVDDFVSNLRPDARAAFEHIRALAESVVPEAEQGTSYGMPALKHRGRPLLGFAEAKAHLSVFPFSPDVIDQVRDRLDGYSLSKGTIRFTDDHLLPDDVVLDVVRLRRDQIDSTMKPSVTGDSRSSPGSKG